MEIQTHSERVDHSRKMVLEFLASSVDLSVDARTSRAGSRSTGPIPSATARRRRRSRPASATALRAGHHETPDGQHAATVHQPVKVDNELYVRDYSKCILCYKCVEGCGTDWQNTFAIAVAGPRVRRPHRHRVRQPAARLRVRLLRQLHRRLPHRRADVQERVRPPRGRPLGRGASRPQTTTICPYCGVGCNLELHEQDNEIVKVTSPLDHPVTRGNLCIKGRFGFQFIQNHEDEEPPEFLEILERGGRRGRRKDRKDGHAAG